MEREVMLSGVISRNVTASEKLMFRFVKRLIGELISKNVLETGSTSLSHFIIAFILTHATLSINNIIIK